MRFAWRTTNRDSPIFPKERRLSAAFGTRGDSTSMSSSQGAAKGANAFSRRFQLEPNCEPINHQHLLGVRGSADSRRGQPWAQLSDVPTVGPFLINSL